MLLKCLVEQIDPQSTTIHFSKRLVSFELPSDDHKATPIKLNFKDGTNAKCDVLIGADGIHSSIRHVMLDLAAQNAEKSESEDSESSRNGGSIKYILVSIYFIGLITFLIVFVFVLRSPHI